MVNAYADLATLKSASLLNVPDDAHDGRLLGLLEAASRRIEGYCDRSFAAVHAERRFDGTGRAALAVPDLIAVAALRVRGAAGEWANWPSGHWLPYPLNAAPAEPGGRPYTRIMLSSDTIRRFPLSRAGVAVTGIWGYGSVREDTGLQVAGGSPVAVDDAAVSVSPANGIVSAGHTIRIDDEDMYATGGGTATLTVRRGVNGTPAAAHAAAAAVWVYRYPDAVTEACLRQAAAWWRERQSAPFAPPAGNNPADADGIDPTARALLEPFRRRAAALGV